MYRKSVILFALALFCLTPGRLLPQTFTEIPTPIQQLSGTADWGDYDSDGDMDLLISGLTEFLPAYICQTRLYANYSGQFYQMGYSLPDVHSGVAKWLDYNNDDTLDVLLSGLHYDLVLQTYLPFTKLYKGKANHTFQDTFTELVEQQNTIMDWGDADNDGYVEMAISGYAKMYPYYQSDVYENKNFEYTESAKFKIKPLDSGSMSWGDFDGDNDLDIIHTGYYYDYILSKDMYETRIYRNDIDTFIVLNSPGLVGVFGGSSEWGDYDQDGDLDFLLSGLVPTGTSTKSYFRFYRNNNLDDTFSLNDVDTEPGFGYRKSTWGDMDNDGDLDILVSGSYQNSQFGFVLLYTNNGNNTFSKSESLCDINANSINLADYDKDGDLDVYINGHTDYAASSKLFRNNTVQVNTRPSKPTNTKVTIDRKKAHFCWSPSTDDHTPTKCLTYNLSVGSEPANSLFMNPNSLLSSGYRKIVRQGNTSIDTCWSLNLKDEGRYYWQVQSIDNAFLGSEFSGVGSFVIGSPIVSTEPGTEINQTSAALNGKVNPLELNAEVYFEYGIDTNNLIASPSMFFQGDTLFPVKVHIQNLVKDSEYFYRIKALNSVDTVNGNFISFHTKINGISENYQKTQVYPNPNGGIFQIGLTQMPDGEIFIFDILGRKRLQMDSNSMYDPPLVDISDFESGLYTLIYSTGKLTYHCRIVKQ